MKNEIKLLDIFGGKGGILSKAIFIKFILFLTIGMFLFPRPIWAERKAEELLEIQNDRLNKLPTQNLQTAKPLNLNLSPIKLPNLNISHTNFNSAYLKTNRSFMPVSNRLQLKSAPVSIGLRTQTPKVGVNNTPRMPRLMAVPLRTKEVMAVGTIKSPALVMPARMSAVNAAQPLKIRNTAAPNVSTLKPQNNIRIRDNLSNNNLTPKTMALSSNMALSSGANKIRQYNPPNTLRTPRVMAAPTGGVNSQRKSTPVLPAINNTHLPVDAGRRGANPIKTPALVMPARMSAPAKIISPVKIRNTAAPITSKRNIAVPKVPTIKSQNDMRRRDNRTRDNLSKNNYNRASQTIALSSGTNKISQFGQLKINSRFANVMISSAKGLNLLPRQNFPAKLPRSGSNIPLTPSRERQPLSLPSLPSAPDNPTSQASGGNNAAGSSHNHSSSSGHSSGSGFPLTAPLILGLCGQLPITPKKRAISRIISEVSRRQKNGIGFILAPRAPNIIQMDECSLAFVHQIKREKQTDFISFINHPRIKLISLYGFFVLREGLSFPDRLLRSQDNCGLFYPVKSLLADGIFHLVRKDGR